MFDLFKVIFWLIKSLQKLKDIENYLENYYILWQIIVQVCTCKFLPVFFFFLKTIQNVSHPQFNYNNACKEIAETVTN